MNDDAPITIHVPNDYGTIRRSLWGAIDPTHAHAGMDWHAITELLDPGLIRQALSNRIQPFHPAAAARQHDQLRAVLRERGIEVHVVDPLRDTFSQYGTRDVAICVDDLFIVARPRRRYRQREVIGLRGLLRRIDPAKKIWLDAGAIEGGDVALHEGKVLVGLSEESDYEGVDALRYALAAAENPREVVPIEFAQGGVIHLDAKFVIVGPTLAVAHPKAFTPASLRLIEAMVELIAVTDDEARDMHANCIALGGGAVLVKQEGGDRLASELARHGLTPVPIPYAEVTTLPGSLHCTTLPLARDAT